MNSVHERRPVKCLIGTGAQVTDYLAQAADSLAGMAGRVLERPALVPLLPATAAPAGPPARSGGGATWDAMPKLPGFLFQALFFGGCAILMAGGVQWQVSRKQRTNFNDKVYIEDARTGNSTRYRVLVGKNDTAGEYFTVEVLIRAQAYGAVRDKPGSEPAHYHLHQEERVRVVSGKLGYFVGHQHHVQSAEAGEVLTVRPGESHMLFNAGGGANGSDLLLELTFTPARHGEALFETLAGLGYDYESPLAVSPVQRWMTLGRAEVVLSDMPPATWEFVQGVIVPAAAKMGYRPFYAAYTTRREWPRGGGGGGGAGGGEEREEDWEEERDGEERGGAGADEDSERLMLRLPSRSHLTTATSRLLAAAMTLLAPRGGAAGAAPAQMHRAALSGPLRPCMHARPSGLRTPAPGAAAALAGPRHALAWPVMPLQRKVAVWSRSFNAEEAVAAPPSAAPLPLSEAGALLGDRGRAGTALSDCEPAGDNGGAASSSPAASSSSNGNGNSSERPAAASGAEAAPAAAPAGNGNGNGQAAAAPAPAAAAAPAATPAAAPAPAAAAPGAGADAVAAPADAPATAVASAASAGPAAAGAGDGADAPAAAAAAAAGVQAASSSSSSSSSSSPAAAAGDGAPPSSSSSSSSDGDGGGAGGAGAGPAIRLLLQSGAAMLPHPDKAHRGGEDSFFIADHQAAVGVADGVGGWAEIGVDAGAYARLLMVHAKEAADSAAEDLAAGTLSSQAILESAFYRTNVQGSSTACVLVVNGTTLSASNLGDSGFVLVRDGAATFQCPQQQHNFNFPFQLGSADSMSDQPQAAMRFDLALQPGDIIVTGSDGLWDNIFAEEAATIASKCRDKGETATTAAQVLCRYARMRASDAKYHSPFSYAAIQAGYVYLGGKMDDITVLQPAVAAMPTLNVITNVPGNGVDASDGLKALSQAVAAAVGKPEQWVMVSLTTDKPMCYSGNEAPCAYAELISIGAIGGDKNKQISAAICDVLKSKLKVDPSRVYIKFVDVARSDFGWNSSTREEVLFRCVSTLGENLHFSAMAAAAELELAQGGGPCRELVEVLSQDLAVYGLLNGVGAHGAPGGGESYTGRVLGGITREEVSAVRAATPAAHMATFRDLTLAMSAHLQRAAPPGAAPAAAAAVGGAAGGAAGSAAGGAGGSAAGGAAAPAAAGSSLAEVVDAYLRAIMLLSMVSFKSIQRLCNYNIDTGQPATVPPRYWRGVMEGMALRGEQMDEVSVAYERYAAKIKPLYEETQALAQQVRDVLAGAEVPSSGGAPSSSGRGTPGSPGVSSGPGASASPEPASSEPGHVQPWQDLGVVGVLGLEAAEAVLGLLARMEGLFNRMSQLSHELTFPVINMFDHEQIARMAVGSYPYLINVCQIAQNVYWVVRGSGLGE
ncbi:protein phosphatase 2C [Scenedesmus sp. PABB004]|nr:protein phosphatase 2C [Scenedesmus sp. PABB004]